jgi:hypothetical protein
MAIASFEKNRHMGVIGKIRLGEKKISQGGKEYPVETPHFVLTDAPDVARVYGDAPTSIDCFFISDDPNEVMPYWYKWYAGGAKDKDGKMVGGRLQCYGNGEVAHHMAKRDPVTRVVPTRTCLAEKCTDWIVNGKQQCRPSMSVYVLVPLASLFGVYQIDTNSVSAINNFISIVGSIKAQWGVLKNIPFRIYREPTNIQFVDKDGKSQSRVHYVLNIVPNKEGFLAKHGDLMRNTLLELSSGAAMAVPTQKLLEESTNDIIVEEVGAKPPGIEAIAEDPELAPLFVKLTALKGKANSPKTRQLTARQFEKATDIKGALMNYLNTQIADAEAKAKAAATVEHKASPPPPAAPMPQGNADGLI